MDGVFFCPHLLQAYGSLASGHLRDGYGSEQRCAFVQVEAKIEGQLIQVIFFYGFLLSACASKRDDYTIITFNSMLASHAIGNRRFCPFVSEDMSPQRHLPTRQSLSLGAGHARPDLVTNNGMGNTNLYNSQFKAMAGKYR
ncbi:hypothetical protein Y032_0770g2214 [Ancylostoma ceylanicum]|uniref:Uncharacterized protein n=1 Tax=Ancylostoma ceylanicum TaxID=53326 RepID=A0A016WDK1_9BILA|nr:hypothetical protein Y032_0770g2214 [Ancylostoma ceylanicum]